MTEDRITDEELTAWLDGEVSAARAGELEALIARDPDLRARVEALEIDRGAVAAALDLLFEPQAPAPAEVVALPPRRRVPRGIPAWGLAAAIVLSLGLGALGYRALAPSAAQLGWQDLAAAYHALYVTDTLTALPDPSPAQTEAQFARAEAALAHPIPRWLAELEGLDFRRVQILGHDGAAIIQLAYLDPEGVPFALCLRRSDAAVSDGSVAARSFAGVEGAAWTQDGVEYILLADRAEADVLARVERIRSAL